MVSHSDFDAFYLATYRRLVKFALPLVGSMEDAEEVAQEAFVRALPRWTRIRDYDQPEAWLRRVAANLASSRRLRARLRTAAFARHGPSPAAIPAVSADDVALVQGLRGLPTRYRETLALRYIADLTVAEIAAELDIPVSTVTTRLSRGRVALAAALGSDDSEDGHEEVQRIRG